MKEIKISDTNEIVYTFTTPTNLPVYMWVNNQKKNVFMTLNVRYGSKNIHFKCNKQEYSVPTGTAHYLEHLKFHLKDKDASDIIFDLGGDTNAYTSINETSFEVYANKNIYEACKVLLDFVQDNFFTKSMVNNERGIILEEANSYKDNPKTEFYQKINNALFNNLSLKHPVIGYERDINKIELDDIALVHEYFYRPENMFMVITGSFDPEKMKKTILDNEKDRTYKNIGKIEKIKEVETKELREKKIVIYNKNCANTSAKYIIKTLESDYKGYTKEEILCALKALFYANFGTSSDFYEYIMQNQLATYFGRSISYDDGVICLTLTVESEEYEKVFKLVDEKINDMKIDKSELNRYINVLKSSSIMKYDNIYSAAASFIGSLIDDDTIDSNRLGITKKLTIKKIMDIYSKVDISNKLIAALKPEKKKQK